MSELTVIDLNDEERIIVKALSKGYSLAREYRCGASRFWRAYRADEFTLSPVEAGKIRAVLSKGAIELPCDVKAGPCACGVWH